MVPFNFASGVVGGVKVVEYNADPLTTRKFLSFPSKV